jgi:prevent-host-death family protein
MMFPARPLKFFGDRDQIAGQVMARTVRKSGANEVPLCEIKDDLSRYLREAETQEIVITRHGKRAGVLISFESEEDWLDYRLEHDPRFVRRSSAQQPACCWTRSEAGGCESGLPATCRLAWGL